MRKRVALLACAVLLGSALFAQDSSEQHVQIHGFATQGFMYSSSNNYLGATSSSGSSRWTDGVLSVSDSVTDRLRVGIQLHMYQLGVFGGEHLQLDWVSGDYRFNEHLGIRAGKVKTPLGLFNDSQDVDSVHLWSLLPQSMYPNDNKSTTLAHAGGELYGNVSIGKALGNVGYRAYAGYRTVDMNSGYSLAAKELGLSLESAGAKTFGGDLRFRPHVNGLMFGASVSAAKSDGTGTGFNIISKYNYQSGYYAQYERGRFYAAGEIRRYPQTDMVHLGPFTLPVRFDLRSWYAMTSYRLAPKLNVGSYYTQFEDKAIPKSSKAQYMNDFVASARYDVNQFVYLKLEGHFIDGNGLGFYNSQNPQGLKPRTNLIAAKIGFSF